MKQDRYARQTALPEIGISGQEKIKKARVLIVGVGGLGSPIALYLAGAGVGTLGLIDSDNVSISNLQRQILYSEKEVGMPKVECAAAKLQSLNSDIRIEPHYARLTPDNAETLMTRYDVVVDGCDNFATRYLINDICIRLGKPYVYGAIQGFEGQVSVFCHGATPKTYRDLYPDEQETLHMPAPSNSVIGVTPGIVGCAEANETLKLLTGYGELLAGKLWVIDLRTMRSHILSL